MVRIVKSHAERRDEIIDVAQEFFYSKGYDQTSIQEIIDTVGIAKGTFYHYFSSKSQLLDEIIERMIVDMIQMVEPIVDDEGLDALQKFHLFFGTVENWKIDNITFLKSILRVYYHDDNALLRQRQKTASRNAAATSLTKIIRQGNDERIFQTQYPEDISEIVVEISQSLAEQLAYMLLDAASNGTRFPAVKRKIVVYQFAMEQLLGAPEGSIRIFDFERLRLWFE